MPPADTPQKVKTSQRPVHLPHSLIFLVSADMQRAIAKEQSRTGESKSAVARRWLTAGRIAAGR